MKNFAQMSEAERRYTVSQLLAEAQCRGFDFARVMYLISAMFVRSNVPAPVSLLAWLSGKETQFHQRTTVH